MNNPTSANHSGLSYRDAGVDIDAGDRLVENIKPFAKRTMRPEVLSGIGGFGGLAEISRVVGIAAHKGELHARFVEERRLIEPRAEHSVAMLASVARSVSASRSAIRASLSQATQHIVAE